ncbi:hypothetical protein IC229_19975 [Spirosoma sp. BT702]|uniref:Uncharacterized protein n=1 Tax=Spirosoma profusum TaxID=2771354 RepID=A0A926Y491_9BACT|nr:hypothetical protein [Spirosoma profusum]
MLLCNLVGFLSCQPDNKFTGVSAGAVGRYIVTAYMESGDTLFSLLPGSTGYKPGINKIGVSNFTVELTATGLDQLAMKTTYWRNNIQSTFSKEVSVQLTNNDYKFSLPETNTTTFYEGRVGRFSGLFYERVVDGGFYIPPLGSSIPPTPPSQDIVIIAQPAK